MVMFHVGDRPNVSRILSQGIAGILAGLFTLEIFLAGVLLRNPDCITLATLVLYMTRTFRNAGRYSR